MDTVGRVTDTPPEGAGARVGGLICGAAVELHAVVEPMEMPTIITSGVVSFPAILWHAVIVSVFPEAAKLDNVKDDDVDPTPPSKMDL